MKCLGYETPRVRNAGYKMPDYEKVRLRNVWHLKELREA